MGRLPPGGRSVVIISTARYHQRSNERTESDKIPHSIPATILLLDVLLPEQTRDISMIHYSLPPKHVTI